jgi:protein NrfD
MMLDNTVKLISQDPGTSPFWWQWPIPVYLFLGGLVAGMMILISLIRLRFGNESGSSQFKLLTWAPSILLSFGMLGLFINLTNKLNVLRFYMTFEPTAPSSWGAWILIAVYPVSLIIALSQTDLSRLKFPGKELLQKLSNWAVKPGNKRFLLYSNMILGIALGIYTGILLSNLGARPLWNSALLGPLFLVSGASTGAAFMLLFGLNEEERKTITAFDTMFIILEGAILTLLLLSLTRTSAITQKAAELILSGQYMIPFWIFVVTLGLAIPLALNLWERLKGGHSRYVLPLLILTGGFALRWVMVFAGQTSAW